MCLYPKLIKNRKYIVNKKNGGNVPIPKDKRVLWVPVGCQKCMECKKQKANQWKVRLSEEVRNNKEGQFVTLTFSNESIKNLVKELPGLEGYELDNEIATLAVRRFLERWRKKHKKSVKHWLITELGHEGTENIHIHGIIFTKHKEDIKSIWGYGFVFNGTYVNERTVNYITKYVTKTDIKHKEYNSKILTSPGIGNNYMNRLDANLNKFGGDTKDKESRAGETDETYKTRQGYKLGLPIYYRNKIYTEDQREELWLEKLNKQERWILGTRVSVKNGWEEYYKVLEEARMKNTRLGYGNDEENWSQAKYENEMRKINMQKRLQNNKENNTFDT